MSKLGEKESKTKMNQISSFEPIIEENLEEDK
jgi:hypothetical protein